MTPPVQSTIPLLTDSSIEMQNLVSDLEQGQGQGRKSSSSSGSPSPPCFLSCVMSNLDVNRNINVKLLAKRWKPHFDFFIRLLLVSTFLDDSMRTLTNFPALVQQLVEQGFLKHFVSSASDNSSEDDNSSPLLTVVAAVILTFGLVSQLLGSLTLLAKNMHDPFANHATAALIGWTVMSPVLFSQLSNWEYVAESMSLLGGLFMLRAHLVYNQSNATIVNRYQPVETNVNGSSSSSNIGARTQLLGRVLLPSMHIYYTGIFCYKLLSEEETNSALKYIAGWSMFVLNTLILLGLLISSTFVAVGLKSRMVAFCLALVNIVFAFHRHPFFRMLYMENGEWKYNVSNVNMPDVVTSKDINAYDFETWEVYDLHRYYFFLGMSISGSLLVLSMFGPGDVAVEKDEVLLPRDEQEH
eukprot:CAMPEP_0194108892 /NCGR_PEP_ID=MMETSP0150-20130528/8520_1 /TAXON_ID=122233 /ORGANISM="Chaetoceros debilis, Strain MM31A-1" /LENGTH=411 /DNA_ID=CAMNT_0038797715 /DNA_START=143 /DNA_END=1378 /DNA_ORIENTATION=-